MQKKRKNTTSAVTASATAPVTRPARPALAAAGILLGAGLLSACAGQQGAASAAPTPTASPASATALSPSELWSTDDGFVAEDARPASSLSALADRAERIAVGRVVEVRSGAEETLTLADGRVGLDGSTVFTVDVAQTIAGEPAEQVRVWIGGERSAAQTGIIGPRDAAAPVTVLDPGLSGDIVPAGASGVGDVVSALQG